MGDRARSATAVASAGRILIPPFSAGPDVAACALPVLLSGAAGALSRTRGTLELVGLAIGWCLYAPAFSRQSCEGWWVEAAFLVVEKQSRLGHAEHLRASAIHLFGVGIHHAKTRAKRARCVSQELEGPSSIRRVLASWEIGGPACYVHTLVSVAAAAVEQMSVADGKVG